MDVNILTALDRRLASQQIMVPLHHVDLVAGRGADSANLDGDFLLPFRPQVGLQFMQGSVAKLAGLRFVVGIH